jgi:hypothetical protein
MTTTAIKWVRHLISRELAVGNPCLTSGPELAAFSKLLRSEEVEVSRVNQTLICPIAWFVMDSQHLEILNGVPDNSLEFDFRVKCIRATLQTMAQLYGKLGAKRRETGRFLVYVPHARLAA